MTAKEIFESIDLGQLPKEAADKFRKVEKATKGFTIESEKVNTFMRGAYKKIKETKPTALKNLKVEEKVTKKEVKKGKTTEVVENLEYKVKGTKKVSKKTPTPSKPKRSGETAMERARKIRKKGEAWKDALARAQKELKAEASKAKKDAEKVVSTTSQALKNLEKMIQNDPKLKGYPRTYGKQSKRIDANKDAKIKAKPAGKRVSKKGHKNQYGESKGGRVYWENRDNRSDRYAPNFPNKVFLEMGGETDDLGFPTGHTYLVVEVSPDGTKNLIKSTKDYMTALMSSAVARGMKSNKDARVVIVDKEDKKVIHEAFEAGGEITITPTQLVNNPDALVGTTTMTELFECGGVTAYQEGGEVFVTPNPLLNAGSGDYVAGSNTMSNMFAEGGATSSSSMTNSKRLVREWKKKYDFSKLLVDSARPILNEKQLHSLGMKIEQLESAIKREEENPSGMQNLKRLVKEWKKPYDFSKILVDSARPILNEKELHDLGMKIEQLEWAIKRDEEAQGQKMAKGGSLKRYDDKIGGLYDNLEQSKDTIEETQEFLQDIYGKEMTYQDRLAYRYAKGGKLPKNIKYYGVNEIKEYRLKNGDKIDPSKTFVDSGVYVSATKTMKPKEKEFQQKLEFKKGGATNWKGEKINWKEDYIYIPRYEIEEVELENGKVIKGDYVVSGIYRPKSDRTKQLEGEMKARMKKMETGGTIVAADPSAAMEDLNQTYGFESVYEKGGATPESIQRMQEKLINDLWDRKGYDIAYLAELPLKQLKSLYDTEFYYEDEFFEKGGRLGFEGLAKKVAKRYEGKPVKGKYQKDYGKTYSKEEAMEVGRKVAAKVYGQQQANMKKMADGGLTASKKNPLIEANNQMIADIDKYLNSPMENSQKELRYREELREQKAFLQAQNLHIQDSMMAKGGSLDGHGLQLGDKIVEDLGSVLKVTTKDGGMVYVDLASGYRGKDMPLPFAKGGMLKHHIGDEGMFKGGEFRIKSYQSFPNRYSIIELDDNGNEIGKEYMINQKDFEDNFSRFAKGGAVGGMKIPDIAKKFGKTTADVMKQVEIGAKHEMEHTSDAKKARKIALDHLSGDLDYYTKLNKLGL